MIPEETKSDRAYNQLGLPPMELAETSNERSSRCLYRCIYPTLQKIFLMMVLITFITGLYVLVLKVLSAPDTNQKTEIILVTGQDTHNVTVSQNDWQIWFQLKNHSETNLKRKKRDLNDMKQKEMLDNLSADDLEKAKEIIRNHNSLCHSDKYKDTCSELIEKLDNIINHRDASSIEAIDISNMTDSKKQISDHNEHVDISPSDVLKRHTNALNKIRNDINSDQEIFSNPLHKTINMLDSDANYNMPLPNQLGQNFPNYLGQGLSMDRPNQLTRELLNNFDQDVTKNLRNLPHHLGPVVPDHLGQDISKDLPNHFGQGFPNHLGQSLSNHLEQDLSNHLGQGLSKHLGQGVSNHFGRGTSNHVEQGVLNLHPHLGMHTHLSDTCLLAKLLKQNYPNAQEIYDPQSPELSQFGQSRFPQISNFQSSLQPFMKHREVESSFEKLHPQDLNIFMNFFNKQNLLTPDDTNKKSGRSMQCPSGSISCDNNEDCVQESEWCDGNVDCVDASDEVRCSCRSRIDKSRLCDGYFDCPFGEDEMGCFGCSDTTFSCGNAQNSCFTKEQRCNSVNDCSNHRDEIECNMLAPTLSNKPMFAVSNTEGYLHRNFKGDWYAVCQNPYMWAHDACRRETGLIIRPPMMQVVPVDPTMKVKYLNTGPGGFMQTSEACFNSSAIYVTCPDLLCGTRVETTTQSLREDMDLENQLFGRNKRFLYPFFEPYRMAYYGNRKKRDTSDVSKDSSNDKTNSGILNKETGEMVNDNRLKRAEERVVGGKASQPAAWPWMAAIYRDGMFHCGGVILNQFWIVSAAHCFHKFWDHYYEVQVGMLRRFSFSPQEHNHRVAHVIVNHGYSEADMISDLSLLKVEPAIQFSRWVRPICLPSPHTAGPDWMWGPSPGTVCTAVGWGATIEHGADPDHLREVKLPIWEHCKHREDTEGKEICAGFVEGGKDACQGDSGGPLLCRNPLNSQQWYLAGIVSHGDGCARKDEPGVYTRVSLFVKWIKYHTSSKSLPLVQPKQDCPGFKCFSGVSKCLPTSRKCDRIVDCLDAEDETNCNFMRSSNDINTKIVNSTKSKIGVLKVSREASAELFSSEIDRESESEVTNIVSSTTEKRINLTNKQPTTVVNETPDMEHSSTLAISRIQSITEKHNFNPTTTQPTTVVNETPNFEHVSTSEIFRTQSITEKYINLSTKQPATDVNKTPDFEHASTLEISPTQSIEETEDSMNNGNPESSSESESHSIVITNKPDLLESRSSILERTTDSKIESTSKPSTKDLLTDAITTTTLASVKDTKRGDVNFDDTNTLNNLLTNAETTTEAKIENNNHENDTENLFVKLPLGPILQPNKTSIEVGENKTNDMINSSESHETSEENSENISNELTALKNNETSINLEAKNLPDTKNGHAALPSIEDLVLSEIKLATIKRKPRVPKEFQCRRIFQVISYNRRCDRKADCEDGTDELDCMCVDYLLAFDEKLICDGVFDCADGQDEIDCFSCPEDHFLCKRSETCLPKKYVCDGKIHCSLGEDEQNCLTLSNGRQLVLDIDEKPQINLEGFLTKRKNDDWSVVCDDKLDMEQQEAAAMHICRYLGFSAANKYLVKYVNMKNEDIVRPGLSELMRAKRASARNVPLNFVFTELASDNKTSRDVVIEEPHLIKEECVPNVTKTCKSLYVVCDRTLFTNFEIGDNTIFSRAAESEDTKISRKIHTWPWIAKVYVDGDYKCTGILVDVAWVLVSDSCLWDTSPMHNFITVSLGSHRTLNSIYGWNEQNIKVTAKKHLYKSRTVLLYLKSPAKYSNMVKPMTVASPYYTNGNIICVAVGEDNYNNTISVFLNETMKNCKLNNRCFVRRDNDNICQFGEESHRNWSGLISCHSEHGWYPAASFVDSRGECGLGNLIVGTDIENLRFEIKYYTSKVLLSESAENISDDFCHGIRCGRGRCVPLRLMCDEVSQCEDGIDESEFACTNKHSVCSNDTFQHGCECSASEMKCKNGRCISKSLFRDGKDDCEDGSDEPPKTKCSDYLAAVTPARLCDGILHCDDRSDENPMFCKCFAKNSYMCSHSSGADYCIASDMLCDGIRDCPNGDDERHCIGLTAPKGLPYGTGQVIVRSHGVWRSKCYPTQNHTKSELEAICSELGFLSGHAKEIKDDKYLVYSHNNLILEPFADVVLNNKTVIKLRNTNEPVMVKSFFDASLKNCFPVFIECL